MRCGHGWSRAPYVCWPSAAHRVRRSATSSRRPDISLFRKNTAAFVHESTVANVEGDNNYVRVQVLTNAGALDRAKQLTTVSRLAAVVAEATGDPSISDRTWVQLTETYDGGSGLAGHANTNDELVALARAELTGS